jgi:hypothetical protein
MEMEFHWPGPPYMLNGKDHHWTPMGWEYSWVTMYSPEDVRKEADQLGAKGWEMVNFTATPRYTEAVGGGGSAWTQMTRQHHVSWSWTGFFKRIVPQEGWGASGDD